MRAYQSRSWHNIDASQTSSTSQHPHSLLIKVTPAHNCGTAYAMPRPKRSKVAPSAPITLPHLAKQAVASAAQKQKDTFSPASSGRVTTTSDDSDGLVFSKKTGARDKGIKATEYTMSGALAPEDMGTTRLKPPSNQTRAALSQIAREADHAKRVAEAKAKQDAAQAEPAAGPDQIPLSIPTESVPASKPSVSGIDVPAINSARLRSRVGETSPPQPSMLGATFKKRARQPSLLQMLGTQNNSSAILDDDEFDDFCPVDESTPMVKSTWQSTAQRTSSSSHQSSGSRKRKLTVPEIQVPASQSRDPPSSPPSVPPTELPDTYDLPADEEERTPEPTLPPPRSTNPPQRELDSDTLAPPQSSTPTKPKPRKPRHKPPPRPQHSKRRQPSPAPSPLSSTSTTISPTKTIPLKPLTTATLQNLLPRRRRTRPKPQSEYDIPSSSDREPLIAHDEDEDELTYHLPPTKPLRRKKPPRGRKAPAPVKTKPKAPSRTYTKRTTPDPDDEEENRHGSGSDDDGAGRGGRKKTPALDARATDAMRRLADKFREVDAYALEFEEMTGNSSGQMRDAR